LAWVIMSNHDHLLAQEGYIDKAEEYLFNSAGNYFYDKNRGLYKKGVARV
jgi:hypothetical protein